jgi:hypothetical protein
MHEPVPRLADEHLTAAAAGEHGERAALERRAARRGVARGRGEHDLGAHVDRQHVELVDRRALRDPADLLEVLDAVGLDRRAEARGRVAHLCAVPAGVVREHLVVRLDRAPHPRACGLAVLATPLAGAALHTDPGVHAPPLQWATTRRDGTVAPSRVPYVK